MSIKTGGVGDNPAIDKMMNATSASIGTYAATVMAAKIIKGKKGGTGKRLSSIGKAEALKHLVPPVQSLAGQIQVLSKARQGALERHQVEKGKEENFFKGFENIEEEYLVEGALLTCTGIEPKDVYIIVGDGTEKHKYEGKPDRKHTPLSKISGTPKNGENCYAKISDAIEHVNIQPFGNCKYSNIKLNEPKITSKKNDCETYGTCYALMELNEKWENMAGGSKYNKNNKFEDCINMLSQLACFQGGIIFPVDTGQEMCDFENNLRAQGFTDSYISYLITLHAKYPKWEFVADVENVDFSKFVDEQYKGKEKCAEPGSSFGDGTNFKEEPYYENATKDAISFFADPRAMLTYGSGSSGDYERVFQFLDYDQYKLSENESEEILNNMISDPDLIEEIMKVYEDISPVMLGAIYGQENGPDGEVYTLNGVSKTVYNLFNVGADGGGNDALKYAHEQNWVSREACISGSLDDLNIKFGRGQSTFYALDWNYKTFSTNGIIDKQYATLVTDAAKKSILICQKTDLTNLIDYEFVFRIPVYSNLPTSVPSMP